jgi:hypothetical protein
MTEPPPTASDDVPYELTPSEPTPPEPTPFDSTPLEPTPSDVTPTETEATPSEPTPFEPIPLEPNSCEPTPTEPTSSEPTMSVPTQSKPTFFSLESLRDQAQGTSFTWEHFFVEKCGILREDALRYEANLISHRMSPQDTLIESLSIIVSIGQIPIGDKIKITKTVERQSKAMESSQRKAKEARGKVGLGEYDQMAAQIILDLSGGTTDLHIECGIEQWEDGQEDFERMVALSIVKAGGIDDGMQAMVNKMYDPAVMLLNSFGYETFDYIKDKEVGTAVLPPQAAQAEINDLLFGHLSLGEDDVTCSQRNLMYI